VSVVCGTRGRTGVASEGGRLRMTVGRAGRARGRGGEDARRTEVVEKTSTRSGEVRRRQLGAFRLDFKVGHLESEGVGRPLSLSGVM
jgi:hypothetical protein